jgi:hypothetical protein
MGAGNRLVKKYLRIPYTAIRHKCTEHFT